MAGHTLLNPPGLPAPISHYSNGVKVGDTVYVSGQVALDGEGRLVGPGDVVAQTRQVLDNIRRVLAAGGATLDDVVKVTVFLANVDERRPARGEHAPDVLQHLARLGDDVTGADQSPLAVQRHLARDVDGVADPDPVRVVADRGRQPRRVQQRVGRHRGAAYGRSGATARCASARTGPARGPTGA